MAKKEQPKLSYGPNMGLIAGEAKVAASEADLTNIGSAFTGGAASVFAAFKQEEKAMENKMEAYSAAFPGLEQSYFMENASNKQLVRSFLNDQRDEYVKLAEIYENTKDRTVMDKMKAIEFSIRNLDDQIKVFNTDKAEYRKAFDDGQLASGKVYEKDFFTNIYTDNSSFVITENGDISFDKGGKKNNSKLYKDHAGNWINRNNISETYFLETYSSSYGLGEAGKSFNEKATYSSINANLKATGNEGLQTIATTDLASDDSSLSFEEQWAGGLLDESFYKGREIEDGTDWMFDNKNADELRDLISNYYTNVMKDGHVEGRKSYAEQEGDANVMVNNRLMSSKDFKANYGENTDFGRFLNGEGEVLRTPGGFNYERRDGVIYQRTDTGFDKQVTEDDIRSNDKLPGISKSNIDSNMDVNVEGQETPVTQILQHDNDPNKMYNMGTMVGNKSFSDLFSGDVDDDDVAKMLQAAFPNLKIIAPFNVKEKIKVNNREFNVKDKSDMARLLKYLNSGEIQKLISPQPNTEFNSTIE